MKGRLGNAFSLLLAGVLGWLLTGRCLAAGVRVEVQRAAPANVLRVLSEQPGSYVIESAAYLSNYAVGFFDDDARFIVTGYSNATPWRPAYFLQTSADKNSLALAPAAEAFRFFRAKSFDGSIGPVALSPSPIAAVPGGTFNLDWVFTNATPGLEQLIRLRAPGEFAPAHPALLQPGSAVASGELFYLNSAGAWTATETVFTNAAFGGRITNSFPLVREGEWQLEFLLREPGTGRLVEFAAEPLLTGLAPRLRLSLNRAAAGPDDSVQAELRLTGGGGIVPRNVKLAAWMTMPDGTQLSLPAFEPGLSFLYEGLATNQTFTLFHRHFTSEGLGEYGIEARLYDAGTLELLGLASGRFTVCDGAPKSIAGKVFSAAGTALGGGNPSAAEVSAFNLENATVTGTAPISSSGNYSLTVQPGRYALLARVEDLLGVHEAISSEILFVACAAGALTINLTSAPPVALTLAAGMSFPSSSAAPPAPNVGLHTSSPNAPDGLPKPRIKLVTTANGVSRDVANRITLDTTATLRSTVSQADLVSDLEIDAVQQLFVEQQRLGSDTPQMLRDLSRLSGDADFVLNLALEQRRLSTVTNWQATFSLLAVARILVICRTQSPLLSNEADLDAATAAIMTELLNCRYAGATSFFQSLRNGQLRPLLPYLTLTVPPSVPVGGAVTFTGKLLEKNAAGAPQPDQTVKLSWKTQSRSGTRTVLTGAGGAFTWSEPVGSVPGVGEVTVSFSRNDRTDLAREQKYFTVDSPGGRLAVTAPSADVLPGTAVNLRVRWLSPPIFLPSPSLSLAGATPSALVPTNRLVSLNASTNGTLSATNVTLDASGEATVTFTAGPRTGLASIQASYTPVATNPPVSAQRWLAIEGNVQTFLSANLTNIFAGSGTTITAEALVGGARVPALPVNFTLSGPGNLSASSGLTDANGQVVITYHAPTNGPGTATIIAITTTSGQSHTNALTVTYSPPPGCPGQGGAVYCLKEIEPPAGYEGIRILKAIGFQPLNNLGQVIYHARRTNGFFDGFLWENGINLQIRVPTPEQSIFPNSINDAGQIVVDGGGTYFWKAGNAVRLEDTPFVRNGTVINNLGDVLVLLGDQSPGDFLYGLWRNGAVTRFHPSDSGWTGGGRHAINDRQQFLSFLYNEKDPDRILKPSILTGSSLLKLSLVPGTVYFTTNELIDFNNRGQVLVLSYGDPNLTVRKVYVWDDGRWIEMAAGLEFYPEDMNDQAAVVGMVSPRNPPDAPSWAALLKDGRTYNLNSLIDPSLGWYLREGVAINNRNQILCEGYRDGTPLTGRYVLLTLAVPF